MLRLCEVPPARDDAVRGALSSVVCSTQRWLRVRDELVANEGTQLSQSSADLLRPFVCHAKSPLAAVRSLAQAVPELIEHAKRRLNAGSKGTTAPSSSPPRPAQSGSRHGAQDTAGSAPHEDDGALTEHAFRLYAAEALRGVAELQATLVALAASLHPEDMLMAAVRGARAAALSASDGAAKERGEEGASAGGSSAGRGDGMRQQGPTGPSALPALGHVAAPTALVSSVLESVASATTTSSGALTGLVGALGGSSGSAQPPSLSEEAVASVDRMLETGLARLYCSLTLDLWCDLPDSYYTSGLSFLAVVTGRKQTVRAGGPKDRRRGQGNGAGQWPPQRGTIVARGGRYDELLRQLEPPSGHGTEEEAAALAKARPWAVGVRFRVARICQRLAEPREAPSAALGPRVLVCTLDPRGGDSGLLVTERSALAALLQRAGVRAEYMHPAGMDQRDLAQWCEPRGIQVLVTVKRKMLQEGRVKIQRASRSGAAAREVELSELPAAVAALLGSDEGRGTGAGAEADGSGGVRGGGGHGGGGGPGGNGAMGGHVGNGLSHGPGLGAGPADAGKAAVGGGGAVLGDELVVEHIRRGGAGGRGNRQAMVGKACKRAVAHVRTSLGTAPTASVVRLYTLPLSFAAVRRLGTLLAEGAPREASGPALKDALSQALELSRPGDEEAREAGLGGCAKKLRDAIRRGDWSGLPTRAVVLYSREDHRYDYVNLL